MIEISGTTTVVGLLRWPGRQSLSPQMHNAAFAALGLDWAYVVLPTPPDRLGDAVVASGDYRSFRIIIDTDRSSVTLKDGTVLTATSTPSIKFPSAGQSGIKVLLTDALVVEDGATTDVLLDFDAEESFVLRGNTIMQNGLLFKPVIKATIADE